MAAHPRGFGSIRFADLDGDGDLDIVRGHRLGNYGGIKIFRNQGDGTFTEGQSLSGGYWTRVCDVNSDGAPDLVSLARFPEDTPKGLYINDGRRTSWNVIADGAQPNS